VLERITNSWRTTLAGLCSIGSGIGLIVLAIAKNNAGSELIATGTGLISTGIGLLLSKDV